MATLFEELRQERLIVTSLRPQLLGYKLKGVSGPGPSHPTSLCFAKRHSLKNNGWCIHAVGQGWSCRVLEIQAKPSGIPDVPRDPRTRQRACQFTDTSIQPQGGIHHAPSHGVDVSGTRELLITSCAIPWQRGGGRHIYMHLYMSCQCSGDTESGHGKKGSISVR